MKSSNLPKIYLSNKDYDFSAWFNEKTSYMLKDLSYSIDTLQQLKTTNLESEAVETLKEMERHLSSAIRYNVILCSMINGCESNYSTNDYLLILNEGYSGYNKLMIKYGLQEPDMSFKNDNAMRNDISSLLKLPRSNRTLIYDLFEKIVHHSDIDEHFKNDLEKVTMNECSWEWFIDKYSNYK